MRKRLFQWCFGFFLTILPCLAESIQHVQLQFSPFPAVAGEAVSVTISAELLQSGGLLDWDGEVILPPLQHAQWQRGVRGMEISSGTGRKTMLTFRRVLIPQKEGKLTIPPVEIRFHGAKARSAPAELTVEPAGTQSKEEKGLTRPVLRARFSRKGPFRPGETAGLEIELLSPSRFALNVNAFPELTEASGLRLLTLPDGDAANPAFRVASSEERGSGGEHLLRLRFSGRVLFLTAGEWRPEITVPISFRERDFFALPHRQFLKAALPPVSVLPRPPVPAGVMDTGLLGKWEFSLSLSPKECRAGEGAELTLTAECLSQHGSAELFRAPELSAPDCRIYPPETTRQEGKIIVRYALVPLRSGEVKTLWQLAFYDTAAKRNQIAELPFTLTVAPGNLPEAPAASAPPVAPIVQKEENDPEKARFPWKPLPEKGLSLPLLRNTLWLSASFAIGGIILFLLSFLSFNREKKRDLRAARQRKAFLRTLRKKIEAGEEASILFQGETLAAVAEALGLPPGATAEEISLKITDPELRRFFAGCSHAAFSPAGEKNLSLSPALRKKLRKFLSSLALLLFLVFPLTGMGAEKEIPAEEGLLPPPQSGEISAAFCCDKGLLAFQREKEAEALLWFTRAALLDPQDKEIQNCRKAAERALFPQGREDSLGTSSLVSCRDLLRPDHYLLLSGVTLFLLGALLFLRKILPRALCWWGTGFLFFFLVLWITALATQAAGPYSARRLMVTAQGAAVRTMPSDKAALLEELPGGTEAEWQEERSGWMLIHSGETTGWLFSGDAERVFPYGLF